MRDADRGQSELLGFLLVFAAVVLTISFVVVAGAAALEDAREFQRTTNAEGAFTALAENVDDVVGEGAPERSTEVRLDGALLRTQEAELTVAFTNESGVSTTRTVDTEPVVYDSREGTTLTYHSGALFRREAGSAVMYRQPGFLLSSELVVLPVVDTTATANRTVAGSTPVGVRTRAAGTELVAVNESVTSLTVTVTGPNAGAWARYFESFEGSGPVTSVSRSGDTVEATVQTERLYVTVHRVDVTFE